MVELVDVNEQNWIIIAALCVNENQKRFLDSAVGIVARGYVYRFCNAKVIGISNDGQIIGAALVKDMEGEPACCDLQQFLIDARFQNKGYGTQALRLILSRLCREGRYAGIEVCVNRENAAALRMCEKLGFSDTGYMDDSVPGCFNLMYHFEREQRHFSDMMISDFSDLLFQNAFRQYFAELGISVRDWDGLFREMNEDGGNFAFVRTAEDGKTVGFIQCKPIKFTSCFFEETCGFIREFWISGDFRNGGHGAALLGLAEKYFSDNGIYTIILTTDTAVRFYEKHGYAKAPGCKARNQDDVFIKRLKRQE